MGCSFWGRRSRPGKDDLFAPLDRAWKIFQRRYTSFSEAAFLEFPFVFEPPSVTHGARRLPELRESPIVAIAQARLLDKYAPPAIIVTKDGDILYIHGRTGKYLEPSPGKANLNVISMAREGLRYSVVSALRTAAAENREVSDKEVYVQTESGSRKISLTIQPIHRSGSLSDLFLVTFEDWPEPQIPPEELKEERPEDAKLAELDKELRDTRAELQHMIEEKQASQEELMSMNEELQSANEELQSTNEELTSSKEELQSINEEIQTMNAELQSKIEALTQSHDDMRNLLQSSEIPMAFLDSGLKVRRFTDAIKPIINFRGNDIVRPISDLKLNLLDVDFVHDAQEVLETLQFRERRVRTEDGRWLHMKLMPYRTSDNKINGVTVTFLDITEMERLEQSLRDARDFAESIIATIREPLVVLDSELRVKSANHSFYKTFDVSPENTEGKLLYSLGNSQWDIPRLRQLLEDILPKNTSFDDLEVEHNFPKIGERTMLLNARKIQTARGPGLILWQLRTSPIGKPANEAGFEMQERTPPPDPALRSRAEEELHRRGRSIASDEDAIALCHELEVHQIELQMQNEELKRAQTQLAASEEKYRELYEFAPVGYLTLEDSGKILEANLAASSILGKERKNLLNRGFQSFLAPGCTAQFDAFCGRVLLSDKKERVELRLKSAAGSPRWAMIEARSLQESPPHHWLMAILDITERKRAEEALQQSREDLERKVEERMAELVKANRTAEAAAQAKSAFLANMSHEIRTPLNAVIGMTSLLLEDGDLTTDQMDFIETIRASGDALLAIINDILDFSKMDQGRAELEERTFDLRDLVEEALDMVAAQASEKGLNLAYTFGEDLPPMVVGDPARLRQIISNLLSNAVKFTDNGEVLLSISGEGYRESQEIHFSVRDTGIGIPRESLKLLFQSFSQIEPTGSRIYGGTGLGLAISKKLVELMGGRIWVESEEGKGSAFHFTIKASAAPTESSRTKVRRELMGKRVLVVDDNKTNRRIIGVQTYRWEMVPTVTPSAEEALRWIRRGDEFEAAILDVDMQDPEMIALAEEIKKRSTPLVALASLGRHADPNLFQAVLSKPFKPAQLYALLLEIFAKGSLQPAQPTKVSSAKNNPLRILLAEDHAPSQKVVLQMLNRLGYRADVAANGAEALQALERKHYDLVLMDLKLPEMDGLEATRAIRQRWPENGPKILAITAYGLGGDAERCIQAGMDGYLAKPIKLEDLAAILEEHFPGEG